MQDNVALVAGGTGVVGSALARGLAGAHVKKLFDEGSPAIRWQDMVAYQDKLFFIATDDSGLRRLWRSDGTADGTKAGTS